MRLRRSVAILPMNMHKSYRVQELAEKLYAELSARGIEVLMDDRKERPGVMFADMELIGIPHTIVLGDRNLDNDDIEYKYRRNGEKQLIKTGDIVEYLVKAIKANTHLRALNGCQGLFTRTVPMTAHLLRSGLLTFALLLLTACTTDVGRSSPSTSAADDHSSSRLLPSSVKARLPAADCAKSPKATCAPATCCSPPARASHRLGSAPSAPLP